MKVSFILLAYKKPDILRPLIETLLSSGSDVYVHYDASSPYDLENESTTWGLDKYHGRLLHAPRVKVSWGEYSIVQATLNALNLARENGYNSDYFMLISGACMPIKPIWKLEDFLKENKGSDIIEAVDAEKNRWVTAGIQKERWEKYHFFNWRFHPKRFDWSLKLQKKLKIRRKLPLGHTSYMGSQWWCLRASTVDKILSLMDQNPALESFYKHTWVPDELFFQTMVGNLVPHEEIHHEILTRYKFNSWGIPRVYYDGDLPELLSETTFFARKISNREKKLRKSLKDICLMDRKSYCDLMADSNSSYIQILKEKHVLDQKINDNKWHALATSIENEYDYLKKIPNNFIVVVGGSQTGRYEVLSALEHEGNTTVFGDLFGGKRADFGKGVRSVAGYKAENRKFIDHKWHLFLGDLAFVNRHKTIAFSIAGNAQKFLHKLKWKQNVIVVVLQNNKKLFDIESPSLEQVGELKKSRKTYGKVILKELEKRACSVIEFNEEHLGTFQQQKLVNYLDWINTPDVQSLDELKEENKKLRELYLEKTLTNNMEI